MDTLPGDLHVAPLLGSDALLVIMNFPLRSLESFSLLDWSAKIFMHKLVRRVEATYLHNMIS